MELSGRVFIVTGGGGAIGRHIVRAIVEGGGRAAAIDRTLEHARAAGAGEPLAADLATEAGALAMVREVESRLGRVDGLVHTVGGFAMAPFVDAPLAQYDQMFDLNVRTLVHALRAVLPPLRARGEGFVCAFSSAPGVTGAQPGASLYAAAKSAVATLMRSLDGELAGSGVRASVVYPMGAVDTPANRRDMPDVDPRTLIDPADVARAIVAAIRQSPGGHLRDLAIYARR